LPFAVINLVYGINEKIDMVMLERLASSREAGIYAGAYRWVDAVMMFLWTVLPIFFAKFAAHLREPREQQKLLNFGQTVLSIPLIYVAVFVFFYGEKLFWQFTHSSVGELNLLQLNLKILFVSVLVQGFFAIYSTVLTASNWELTVSKLVALSITINVVLNYFFIPQYGSLAASVNTVVSALIIAGGNILLLRPKLNITVAGWLLFKLGLSTVLLGGIFYGLSLLSGNWWVNSAGAGLLFVVLLFGLKIINLQELKAGLTRRA
jgi:O-antigen/teichoic acid export membrane protein